MQSLVEIGPMVLEKKIFKFCFGKGCGLHLNKLEDLSLKDALFG